MKERHNWATGKHPKTCTCTVCTQRRAEAGLPREKKKRKPKSERGKAQKTKPGDTAGALAEAMDILNRPTEPRESTE
ncbi:MAG: hypothetical protein O3B04_08735 [Chloroflexi bacterium]|nr:hypothetical protein [Chloroflexota bacterium]MDA1298064.1 hypothetical protein [Chloroflexota bacterium]